MLGVLVLSGAVLHDAELGSLLTPSFVSMGIIEHKRGSLEFVVVLRVGAVSSSVGKGGNFTEFRSIYFGAMVSIEDETPLCSVLESTLELGQLLSSKLGGTVLCKSLFKLRGRRGSRDESGVLKQVGKSASEAVHFCSGRGDTSS